MKNAYDVIVCGAGIAGMAMALALGKKGIKTALVSPKYQAKANLGQQYHPRIYAISLASQQLLDSLGIWSMLPSERLTAVQSMHVFGDLDGAINLDAYSAAHTQLAWIVESGEIEFALQNALRFVGVPWIDASVESMQRHTKHAISVSAKSAPATSTRSRSHAVAAEDSSKLMSIKTSTGETYSADLLIGADGANSVLRQSSGIKHQARSYEASGQVAQLNIELPHNNTAYQWFSEEGILAFLPLPDTDDGHQVSMVWSAPDAIVQENKRLSPEELQRILPLRLAQLSRGQLGAISLRSPLFSFPLTLEQSDWVSEGVALIGDAAHRVHPLAGQGLNLGLGDVAYLSQLLADKASYRSYGDLRLLQRYQRARIPAMTEMKIATDGLFRLFHLRSPGLAIVRNLGMQLSDKIPPLKRFLIQKATGL